MSEKINKKEVNVIPENDIIECFVIMPISNQIGYDENHFTLVYEDIIQPSIINNNMKPIRADETKNTNLIHLDILKKVIKSPIAICDMSSKNPNVFYELGMRQAFDMPTVLLIDEDTKVPFDISGLRYVTYKKDMSFRNVRNAVNSLTISLKETFEKKGDKTEINSLIRLMELTTAKIENTTISKSEKIELLQELEIREIKNSLKHLTDIQKSILDNINSNSDIPFSPLHDKWNNLNKLYASDYKVGDKLYLNGDEFGSIFNIGNKTILVRKNSGELIPVPYESKLYKELSAFPF